MRDALVAKLASRSFRDERSGCVIWTGGRNSDGYGRVCIAGRVLYAHRVAWEIERGPIAGNLFVCHRCDTPACIEPSHLFLGTNQDNIKDMQAKGRARGGSLVGERNPQAKLTAKQVIEIRRSSAPRAELAQRYGVCLRLIFAIRSGKAWLTLVPKVAA